MEIREATVADFPALAKFGEQFIKDEKFGPVHSYDVLGVQDSVYEVVQAGGLFLSAWEENKPVGFLLAYLRPNFYNPKELMGVCGFIAVEPEFRRKGAGKKIRTEFEKWAKGHGAKLIVYSGFDRSFITVMKREGFKQAEVTLVKEV